MDWARQVDVATPEQVLPLHMAAQFAHVEAAAALVAAGADLAAVNDDGLGVLHAAAIGGSARLVDALLAAGVRRSPPRPVRKQCALGLPCPTKQCRRRRDTCDGGDSATRLLRSRSGIATAAASRIRS